MVLEAPREEDIYPCAFGEYRGYADDFISKRFQWLPSDFTISDTGNVTLSSSYINNIHPVRHADLYAVIPRILESAIPMFERVLSDLRRPLLPMRIKTIMAGGTYHRQFESPPCLWLNDDPPDPGLKVGSPDFRFVDWFMAQNPRLPEGRPYDGDLEKVQKTVSLSGQTVQCIVKLVNIVLTPEKPEYPGGKWHTEGQPSGSTSLPSDLALSY